MEVSILPARDGIHKYKAVFVDGDKKKTVSFGAKGMGDYIQYSKKGHDIGDKHKEMYLARHAAREDWTDYTSPGALSRWILWNERTLESSIADYLRRSGFRRL
jgi:hypothetical protein